MKKILFSFFAVAALSVSCTKFAEDPKIDFEAAAAPTVTAKTVADDQIEVTVAAQDGTSWFSYIVAEGEAEALNASNLLQGKYASGAVTYGDEKTPAAAVLDFKKTTSVKLTIDGLDSNTPYTVYAVASNAQGVVSEVATATTVTTDETEPDIVDYASQEDEDGSLLFQLVFDDPIKLSGEGSVTAHYYAVYGGADAQGNLVEQKSVEIPAEELLASGKNVLVTIPAAENIPGAIVALTYPEGLVVNGLGAKCPAFDDAVVTEALKTNGIAGQYDNVSFKLSKNKDGDKADDGKGEADADADADGPEVFTDWTKLVMHSYAQNKYALADLTDDAAVKITVVDGNGRTVSYDGQQFDIVGDKTVGVALDEDPGYGVSISYTIAAGSLVDIYGNENEEFTVTDGYYCSYGYTLNDIVGTYAVTSKNAFTGADSPVYSFKVEASDDAKKGNIVITDWLGITGKIYSTLDFDNGQFTVKAEDNFAGTAAAGYATFFYQDDEAVFNLVAAGSITSDYLIGVATTVNGELTGYATDAAGNKLLVGLFVATRE